MEEKHRCRVMWRGCVSVVVCNSEGDGKIVANLCEMHMKKKCSGGGARVIPGASDGGKQSRYYLHHFKTIC